MKQMIIDNVATANERSLSVKVSFGNEIRRAQFNGASFLALRELAARLYELDPAAVMLKYQDDEDDFVTLASDEELQEALRLSIEMKKAVRLFMTVEAGAGAGAGAGADLAGRQPPLPTPAAVQAPPAPAYVALAPVQAAPAPVQAAPAPVQAAPAPFQAAPAPFQAAPAPFQAPPAPFQPVPAPIQGPVRYESPVFAHGTFSPAPQGGWVKDLKKEGKDLKKEAKGWKKECKKERKDWKKEGKKDRENWKKEGKQEWKDWKREMKGGVKEEKDSLKQDRKALKQGFKEEMEAFKERRRTAKEAIRAMKEVAVTDEDRAAIKEYKDKIKAEFRDTWKEFKQQKNPDRLVARHVADVTVPDNSELPAVTPAVKTWRLRNEGPNEWPVGCQLIFISHRGDILNGPERVVLNGPPVPPLHEVEVSVPFITPAKPGRYVAYYRMATPDGKKFGQRLWVSFVIPTPDAMNE